MDAVIQYAVRRYEHLGVILEKILPKLDEDLLIEIQGLEPNQENILRLAELLRLQLLAEYQEVPESGQKEFRDQSHQALRGIWEISQELNCLREICREIDLPFFPGETQEDIGPFIGTFQTLREEIHNSEQNANKWYNSTIPTDEDMRRRVTI